MKTEICQNCGRTIGNLETRHLFNQQVVCGECDAKLRSAQSSDPPQTATTPPPAPAARAPVQTQAREHVLIEVHPAMFRNRPILFVLLVIFAVASLGFGMIFLAIWWLRCRATTLTVTNIRTTVRTGLLSKHTNEVRHKDARNIKVSQSLGQRIFGVGTLQVSSAGQSDIEIVFAGLPIPQKVADLIRQYQD